MEVFIEHWHLLVEMGVLLLFSGLFSGSETALFSLGKTDLAFLRRSRTRRARITLRLLGRAESTLSSILFGNMVVNVFYFSTGAVLVARLEGTASTLATVGVFLVLVLVGEIGPKVVASALPLALAGTFAPGIWIFDALVSRTAGRLVRPFLRLGEMCARLFGEENEFSAEELRMLVELSQKAGAIAPEERDMLEDAIEISEVKVREIMVPRVDVIQVDLRTPTEEVLSLAREHTFTRIPVYDGRPDSTVGYVDVRELVLDRVAKPLTNYVKPIAYVPETATVDSLIRRVRDEGMRFALVVDEYGGTAGFVTCEDVLEAIVGEVEDEHDAPRRPAVERKDGGYSLSGDLSITEWRDLFGDPVGEDFDTVGGLTVGLLGRLPREGDTVEYRNLVFTVEEVRRRRVMRVKVEIK